MCCAPPPARCGCSKPMRRRRRPPIRMADSYNRPGPRRRAALTGRSDDLASLSISAIGPGKAGEVGALAGVVPGEAVIGVAHAHAIALGNLREQRMGVALDYRLLRH